MECKDGGKREDGGWIMLELSNLTFSRGRGQGGGRAGPCRKTRGGSLQGTGWGNGLADDSS